MSHERWVPLTVAALRLEVSGEVARRLTLKRQLTGRLEDGRWQVLESSIDALAQARRRAVSTP